jgi:superfamily II DNA/RNA helicase
LGPKLFSKAKSFPKQILHPINNITMKRKLDEHNVPKEVSFWDSAVTFDKLGLDSRLLQAVARAKFSTPTPIQARAIPLASEGKDILGTASINSSLLRRPY